MEQVTTTIESNNQELVWSEFNEPLLAIIQNTLDAEMITEEDFFKWEKQNILATLSELEWIVVDGVDQATFALTKLKDANPQTVENLKQILERFKVVENVAEEEAEATEDEESQEAINERYNENSQLTELLAPFRNEAERKVQEFIDQGNEIQDREQYIKDYALLANKDILLQQYREGLQASTTSTDTTIPQTGETPRIARENIGNTTDIVYSEQGYRNLEAQIRQTEQRVRQQAPDFYQFILQETDSTIPTRLSDAELTDTKREVITSVLSWNDNTESSLEPDGTLTVGDQRIRVNENGDIESEIFSETGRGEVSVSVDMPSLDSVTRENIKLADDKKELNALESRLGTSNDRLTLLEEEYQDALENDSVNVEELSRQIEQLKMKIEVLELDIEKLKKKIEEQEKEVEEELRDYRNIIERNNRRVRDTTKFLTSIGLDQFPEGLLDQIIERLNGDPGLRASLGFHNQIDLGKGDLGFNYDYDKYEISTPEKQAFAQVVNLMISWKEWEPIDINALAGVLTTAVSDRGKFQEALEQGGILGLTGYSTIINRLWSLEDQELVLEDDLSLEEGSQEYPNVTTDTIVDKVWDFVVIKRANSQTLSIYQWERNIASNIKDNKVQSIRDILVELSKNKNKIKKWDFLKYL